MPRICTLLTLLALLLASAISAQDSAEQDEAPDPPEIPTLPFRSYDSAWTRWHNIDESDNPILHHEETSQFPFIWVKNASAIQINDFQDADFLAAFFETHELAYDEDAANGQCDSEKLAKYHSSDLFCAPGAELMPHGHILLALFHPESGELAALTSTIDNNSGGAAQLSAETPEPSPEPAASPMPERCGPYADQEWTSADTDIAAHGLEIRGAHAGTTDYKCVVPADGGAPYFQAYTIQKQEKQGGGANGGQAASGDGGGGRGGGTRGGNQNVSLEPREPLPTEPCTHPLGCDIGDNHG